MHNCLPIGQFIKN